MIETLKRKGAIVVVVLAVIGFADMFTQEATDGEVRLIKNVLEMAFKREIK